MEATTKFLHLLWEHLGCCTEQPEARTCLLRTALVRPITGGLVHGWHS